MPAEPLTDPPRTAKRTDRLGRLTVLESLRRHFVIALLPVVLFIGAAVAIGTQRDPVYTSEARLNVGGLNLTQQSVEGYTHAVQQLAIAYARSIHATGVVEPAARKVGVAPSQIIDSVGATPVQGSPVISIRAKSTDPSMAVAMADAAAASLVEYATELNSGRDASVGLLKRYQKAARTYRRATRELARTPANSERREAIETRVDTARLRRQTLSVLYGQSQAGQATVNIVQKLAPAAEATSDRQDVLQDYVAAGAIAGLLVGVGLAVARANAVARRRLGAG